MKDYIAELFDGSVDVVNRDGLSPTSNRLPPLMLSMLSDAAHAALLDIEYHIDLATEFVRDYDYQSFSTDVRTMYAVTRRIEIISEASRRLPAEMKMRYPSIAWKEMAGAGNIYRHDYEDVAAKLV